MDSGRVGRARGWLVAVAALTAVGLPPLGASGPARADADPTSSASTSSISGAVTRADGTVPFGAHAVVYREGYFLGSDNADGRGRFTVGDLQPGPGYRVCVLIGEAEMGCHGGSTTVDGATEVTLGDAALTGVDITVATPGRVSGRVTLKGAPLPGVGVGVFYYSSFLRGWQPLATRDFTNDHGAFAFPRLSPTDYALRVTDYQNRALTTYSGGATSLDDAQLVSVTSASSTVVPIRAIPALSISGKVFVSGGAPADATVQVYPHGLEGALPASEATTDAQGRYTATRLPAGDYDVRFLPSDDFLQNTWYRMVASRADATPVHVEAGESAVGVNAGLGQAGVVSGTVSHQMAGDPVDATVQLLRRDSSGAFVVVATTTVAPADDGEFHLGHVAPGRYKLLASEDGYRDQRFPVIDGAPRSFVVGPGDQHTAGVVLTRVTSLRGTVNLAYVKVQLYAPHGDGGWVRVGIASSGADSTYSFNGIPAGTYRLGFHGGPPFRPEYYDDQPTLEQATDLHVAAGRWTIADATLDR